LLKLISIHNSKLHKYYYNNNFMKKEKFKYVESVMIYGGD
jgi:hypothetical protein